VEAFFKFSLNDYILLSSSRTNSSYLQWTRRYLKQQATSAACLPICTVKAA